jgi:capsid protein
MQSIKQGIVRALGYDAGDRSRMREDLGWSRAQARDEDSLTSDGTRETIRQKASDLRRNNPIIAGIGNRIASFAVPLLPAAQTSSRDWNQAAEDWWINDYSLRCDSRGRATLPELQWLATANRPTLGGLYLELLANGQIRPIECERIRQPQKPTEADGYVDGVKVDPVTGQVLGYLVHGRAKDGTFSGPHPERFVSAENINPLTTPFWRADQVREIPDLAPIVPGYRDIHEANTYQLNTFKMQSMIVGVMKKLSGAGANSLGRGTTVTPGQRKTFKTEWGQIHEAFVGEDLDLKSSPTPGSNHIPYIKMQIMLSGSAMDFPYEFWTLDFSSADFSRQKAILLLVNKTIRRTWVPWMQRAMQRLWNWRIPIAIANGELPPAPTKNVSGFDVSEWNRVDWQAPEEAWTDRQEANQADLIEYQLGITPLSMAVKRRGGNFENRLRQKAKDYLLVGQISKETGVPRQDLVKDVIVPGQQTNKDKATAATTKDEPPETEDDPQDATKEPANGNA